MIKNMGRLIILLLCSVSLIEAADVLNQQTLTERVMGKIGLSNFMHVCSKCIQADPKVSCISCVTEPASEQFQILGLEAQRALDISSELCLPIIKMRENFPGKKDMAAGTFLGIIIVNEELFAAMPYGVQRSVFMHESTHVKYHDFLASFMSSTIGFCGGSVGAHTVLKALKVAAWYKRASSVIGVAVANKCFTKYRQFAERRADVEGHYATQCASCVHEKMQFFKNCCIENIKKNKPDDISEAGILALFSEVDKHRALYGYLTQQELNKIAQDLGDKKCSYHLAKQK